LHGPIALIERGFPAIVVNPSGRVYDEVSEVEQEMIARGASPVVLSDRADAAGREPTVALPGGVPEWLSPLVSVAPSQLLAYHLRVARGFDPDQPRGLQKVTRTM
ncbi:MAG: glucosamine--fructose-6-phosphate aminotransferase, partial [Chloroflexi bacterium]|nr:glucosamine--fructose-6-phosphate aminotransferase [Chloroflexota bacterium]